MHLAAALDTPVVAVYGLTDPGSTGPLGRNHTLLRPAGAAGRRAIARRDPEAVRALRSIPPERVLMALRQILRKPRHPAPVEES